MPDILSLDTQTYNVVIIMSVLQMKKKALRSAVTWTLSNFMDNLFNNNLAMPQNCTLFDPKPKEAKLPTGPVEKGRVQLAS